MSFRLTRDIDRFDAIVAPFLAQRIECNVMATVLMNLIDGAERATGPLFAWAADAGGRVQAAALRVPPWPLLTSPVDPATAAELMEQWCPEDPDLPGATGVPVTAQALASAWSRMTGGETRVRMRQAMHELEQVLPPGRPAPGKLRPAADSDRELVTAWMRAFALEANLVDAAAADAMVTRWLERGGLNLWDDGGAVCMVGVQPRVAGVARVGPVYTPPPHRRRGYGTSAVAAASRTALEGGARRCMLFTDLANPTSNRIYGEIGYRRVGDWEEYAFLRSA